MLTQTKAAIALAYAFIAWVGVPLPGYAVDLIPRPQGGEIWQTVTGDGVTVRTSDRNAIAYVLARDAPTSTRTLTVTVTAYNSVPAQTDGSPCISADGSDICKLYAKGDYSCASALPFGTKINVPGFGVCTVRDRLAPKYYYRVDIHMGGADCIPKARAWGKKKLTVTVI